jgi:hypothetical protein
MTTNIPKWEKREREIKIKYADVKSFLYCFLGESSFMHIVCYLLQPTEMVGSNEVILEKFFLKSC